MEAQELTKLRADISAGVVAPGIVEKLLERFLDYEYALKVIENPKLHGADAHSEGNCTPYHMHPIPRSVAKEALLGQFKRPQTEVRLK